MRQNRGVAELKTVIPVWVLVALGTLLIGLFSPPDEYLVWLPVTLGVGIVVTFCVQLAIVRKEGLVNRVMASLGGSVVIVGVATGILAVLAAVGR
jgi:hypothetical protein